MLYSEVATTEADLEPLLDLLRGRRIVVLAGAGLSTESGIPDYRGPDGRLKTKKPMQYGEFVGSPEARVRYWSRSTVGWSRIASAKPNAGHRALARLEGEGAVRGLITQNVDGLHQAAGSRRVIELHGSLAAVRCLACEATSARDALQRRLMDANRSWVESLERAPGQVAPMKPDGDAEVSPAVEDDFEVPGCDRCGGVLKPDVVFFGENVPADRVDRAWRLLEEGDVLLVVGSSLTVYSGRRFVYRAAENDMPVGVVTLGPTRADDLATAKVEGRLGAVLPRLADELLRG